MSSSPSLASELAATFRELWRYHPYDAGCPLHRSRMQSLHQAVKLPLLGGMSPVLAAMALFLAAQQWPGTAIATTLNAAAYTALWGLSLCGTVLLVTLSVMLGAQELSCRTCRRDRARRPVGFVVFDIVIRIWRISFS